MWAELRTLFWLQWKLTFAMFRSKRMSFRLRLGGCLMQILMFGVTFPLFILMGIGIGVGLALLSPAAAYEIAIIINTGMLFIWLLLPASYNSQMLERFEMSRLFPFPISPRSIIVGSTVMSMLTMTGAWTVPIILGEVVGLAWHNPVVAPLILLGSLPVFALLILAGRLMEDLFDLVAGDRRLRALMLVALTAPFMFCWMGQYVVQDITRDFSQAPPIIADAIGEDMQQAMERLDEAESFTQVRAGISDIITILRPSRLLIWLPPGWATAGMGLGVTGQWGQALLFLLLSIGFAVALVWVHARITWRLMNGAAMSMGVERVRSEQRFLNLPGPPVFWALFHKDWTCLKRSPLTRQVLLGVLMTVVMIFLFMRSIGRSGEDMPAGVSAAMPVAIVAFAITIVSMTTNLSFAANYYGAIDRKGFATLATSPVDRRYIVLSANLMVLLFIELQTLIICLVVALATQSWAVLPLGLYIGLCLEISGFPAYNLASIIGPFRAQLQFGARQQGNLWGMLAWLIATPPVLLLIVLPYFFWKSGLVFTLPLALIYSLGIYAITLTPLAHLLQRRERPILDAVAHEE
jgi:hypothetical protein